MQFKVVVAALAVVAIALCSGTAMAVPKAGSTLVLLDDLSTRDTHSVFFTALEERGMQVKYSLSNAAGLALIKYGEKVYENLILFSPRTESFGGAVDEKTIIEFIDEGGNVLVAGSSELSEAMRSIVSECGFEMDSEGTNVIDHFNNINGDATTIAAKDAIDAEIIVGKKSSKPVIFRGVGLAADPSNELVLALLSGSSTSYSYSIDEAITEYPVVVGKSTTLVGALQARNNARVVVSGSLDLFGNAFFALESNNKDFSIATALWTFKERGDLRLGSPVHHKEGETNPPREYTVTEQVYYGIPLEEKVDGKWVPAKASDVQMQFLRIDPFVIVTLDNNKGTLETTFKLPDVYGVFQFIVDYQRVGYSFVYSTTQVSVRPFTHTQYERFIYSAYPYYAGAFSMMVGVFLFSFVFLHHQSKIKDE